MKGIRRGYCFCQKKVYKQGLSQDLITGGQFVPLAKILGDIFIFRGTDINFVHPSFLAGLLIGLGRKSQISRDF